ncbi:Bifunctional purine biosynthetic protein ADE1 like [Verticillium longisporum]|nr:Bifunctional purine biosynthetic protein ADE1 like [Verticillium longisporum]
MRVLLIGKGGREHALAWKLCQTAQRVFIVPGNGGTAASAPNVSNVEHADMHDFESLVALARTLAVDLVLPGPDDVVVEGIADVFEQEYRNFDTYEHARDYLSSVNHRVVIKVSGLAAGKGVVLPETQEEAQRELHEMMVDKKFGHQEVVIEEFLSGDEISILAFSSEGYPGEHRQCDRIDIAAGPENVQIFHAGMIRLGDELRTAGGRVLAVAR